jgi:hypothetical protein
MKTDDYVERKLKRLIARLDNAERARIGIDNALLQWVMMYGREPVDDLIVGKENVDRINKLRKAGYIKSDVLLENPISLTSFRWEYTLTNKARQRLEHLSKHHNRSSKK